MPKSKKPIEISEPGYRYIFSAVLICLVFASLFAVRFHLEELGGDSLLLFTSSNGLRGDWFLYCKELLFAVWGALICCYFVGEKIFPDKPCRNDPILKKEARLPLILLGVYVIMAVVSAIFSTHREVVLMGVCSEYEGVVAVIAYVLLFCGGYNYLSGEKVRRFYKRALFVLIAAVVVLSVFEYTVTPLMELPFMKYIIAPAEYRAAAESLKLQDTFREALLMFYNSNYMGGFCTMIFPISVYFVKAADKLAGKLICGAVCAGTIVVTVMSNSTAALYVVMAEGLFMVTFMLAKKIIRLRAVAVMVAAGVVLGGGVSLATGNVFLKNVFKSLVNASPNEQELHPFILDEIHIDGNSVVFSGNGSQYTVTAPVESGETITVTGSADTQFSANLGGPNDISVLDLGTGDKFSASIKNGVMRLDLGYMSTIDFAVTTNGLRAIVQNEVLLSQIPSSPYNGTKLADYYGFATGRGYIWVNSLPILKKCIIIGRGAGNFPFCFVQNEIAGLAATHNSYRLIVDKPHSWYLQIAVTCGIPAMIAILALFGIFVVRGLVLLFGTALDRFAAGKDRLLLMCLFTGLGGFMVIGLVNDSCITVNPFFWFNFGAAYCLLTAERSGEVEKK